jgi:hypothetical protein
MPRPSDGWKMVFMKDSRAFFGTGLAGSFFTIFSAGSLLWIASVLGSYVAGPTTSAVSSLRGSTIQMNHSLFTWDRWYSIVFDVTGYC